MRRIRSQHIIIPAITVVLVGLALAAGLRTGGLATAIPLFQESQSSSCRSIDRSLIEFNVEIPSDSGSEAGQIQSVNDGTLAAIVIYSEVDADGRVVALDFATSVRVNAIILKSGELSDVRAFEPAVRSGAGVSLGDSTPIESVAFCYQVSILSPPRATTAESDSEDASPTPLPTSTTLTLDLGGVKTAEARADQIAATATFAAGQAAEALANAELEREQIAQTATAAAESAVLNEADLAATISAQESELATAEANINAARETAESLQATISAPTEIPTSTATAEPTATPEPVQVTTTVVYETSGDQPFADWQETDGWDLTGEVALTDGSGNRGWLLVPVPPGLSEDAIVEVEFRVTGGDVCPRNFGFGLRGSATGFYAAGVEWACEPGVVLWAGSDVIGTPVSGGVNAADGEWHTMSISAIGNSIIVAIDGVEQINTSSDLFPAGNLVAFWTDRVALEIRHVRVSEVSS